MKSVMGILSVLLVLSFVSAASNDRDRAMMGALMRMELGGQVVAEAQKMSELKEVAAAAERTAISLCALRGKGSLRRSRPPMRRVRCSPPSWMR